MHRWQREINFLLAILAPVLLLGYFTQQLTLILLALAGFLLIKQSIRIDRLEQWLSRGAFGDKRDQKGIWRDIYFHIWKIKKIDKKRKKKLSRMIDRFRTSTDALPDAAVVIGKFGEIEWTNKAARGVSLLFAGFCL